MNPENKAKYLIETFQKNKDEIINIIIEIIETCTTVEAKYWRNTKKEVIRLLSNEKKNITLV